MGSGLRDAPVLTVLLLLKAEMAGDAPSGVVVEALREKVRDLESLNRVAQMSNKSLEDKLQAAADKSVSPRSTPKVRLCCAARVQVCLCLSVLVCQPVYLSVCL